MFTYIWATILDQCQLVLRWGEEEGLSALFLIFFAAHSVIFLQPLQQAFQYCSENFVIKLILQVDMGANRKTNRDHAKKTQRPMSDKPDGMGLPPNN
ncbi:MAG: hypothetical protein PUP92_27220 [Rhizonema sp. PD38]|nr:hypothetical protein [Rhizonema sp. PD38]